MEYEEALLIGGARDGERVRTYPGQGSIKMPLPNNEWNQLYVLHRVHDSSGFHRIIGLLESDRRGPMQALYEGYQKENANA